jgi:hypothetical protein
MFKTFVDDLYQKVHNVIGNQYNKAAFDFFRKAGRTPPNLNV